MLIAQNRTNSIPFGSVLPKELMKAMINDDIINITEKNRNPLGDTMVNAICLKTLYINTLYIKYMWILFHFIFLHVCNVSPLFHFVAVGVGMAMAQIHIKKLSTSDIVPSACMLGLYIGFYLTNELYHLGFLPWWVTSICGFRKQTAFIWAGGILLGCLLYALTWRERIGHAIMNLSVMLRTKEQSSTSIALVHLLLGLVLGSIDWNIKNAYVDVLAGFSAVMCVFFKENMSWLSIGTLFTNPFSTGLCILHGLSPFWYQYYKNNHFRKVKYTYYFVYPMLIYLVLFFREEIIEVRDKYNI
jgi:hypothetical protein